VCALFALARIARFCSCVISRTFVIVTAYFCTCSDEAIGRSVKNADSHMLVYQRCKVCKLTACGVYQNSFLNAGCLAQLFGVPINMIVALHTRSDSLGGGCSFVFTALNMWQDDLIYVELEGAEDYAREEAPAGFILNSELTEYKNLRTYFIKEVCVSFFDSLSCRVFSHVLACGCCVKPQPHCSDDLLCAHCSWSSGAQLAISGAMWRQLPLLCPCIRPSSSILAQKFLACADLRCPS